MAPRSRTGKLIQGLFGRFGKNSPEQSIISPAERRQARQLSQTEIDNRDFPIANDFDDDEQTNWDDAETLADENNPVVYSQPIVPVVAPPPAPAIPDLEEWDEALPAATVKNSSSQEVRRGKKKPAPVFKTEDIWADDLPDRTFSDAIRIDPDEPVPLNRVERAMGFWSDILHQFRRFLPAPIRQLSDAILTTILVMLVTITIWFVDGFFVPTSTPSVANPPSAAVPASPTATEPVTPTATVAGTPAISPEQAFIEEIETQLSEITSQYPDEIVQTLNIDLAHDRAIVRLNPVWYTLDRERQNSLADRMWQQAQANHFTKLELQDDRGVAIARSPVVGKHAIILQRKQI
jgi:hypothetical protein